MVLSLDIISVVEVITVGFIAGTLGGMLGVGGSTIIIPGLTLIMGYNQHLYQAAAMAANVAVSVPAAMRHYRAGAMTGVALRWILAMAVVFVLVGVWLSNSEMFRGRGGGVWLGRVLAVFLIYVIVVNVRRVAKPSPHDSDEAQANGDDPPHLKEINLPVRGGMVGAAMGLIAGLLGIGGGAVAVPLQQVVIGLPLRACIANSSAVICVSATLGAIYKNATLGGHGYYWYQSMSLALLLAPSCWLGGHVGAGLTHRLPVRQVRVVFICLMVVAAVKMAAIF